MQEPIKPKEPVRELVSTVVDDFNSDSFNKLDTLDEQLKYIENCKNKYLKINPESDIVKFKLEFYCNWDIALLELEAYEYEDEYTYNNRLNKYKTDLVIYQQQLEKYNKYKKQLYLQLKEEFSNE